MAGVRLAGLASNMDTDTIVQNMMKAQRMKQDKLKGNRTKLTWQQDTWKGLQTKLYKLYTDFASPMRMSDAYNTKKATSSNSDKVNVTIPPGVTSVPEGTHNVTVDALASSQNVTGGVLNLDKNGIKVTASTKLTDLTGLNEGAIFTINANGKETNFQVRADSTINDYVSTLKGAGLVANFDSAQGRMLISSKSSGLENKFTISSDMMSGTQITSRNELDSYLQYSTLGSGNREIANKAYLTLRNNSGATQAEIDAAKESLQKIAKENAEKKQMNEATEVVRDAHKAEWSATGSKAADYNTIVNDVTTYAPDTWTQADIDAEVAKRVDAKVADYMTTDPAKAKVQNEYNTLNGGIANVLATAETDVNSKINDLVNAAPSLGTGTGDGSLIALGLDATNGADRLPDPTNPTSKMVVQAANDAQITYNGAIMTGSSNSITVNGLTIEAKGLTTDKVSLGVTKDTQAVYDKIKKFVGSYNEILKEMNDLYYAKSSKGYDPLTEEEQAAMTDKQIENWENKIKDSILRRDDNLAALTNGMKNAMMSSVTVDGKNYSLASFGIATSDMDYSEKGLLHIFGDKDDATYASKTDKLMAALNEDPDKVMQVFSKLAGNLYDDMFKQMKGTQMRSALKFYNDKSLSDNIKKYDKDIYAWDKKLTKLESKYYKQFSDMEVALSKLNSQQSSLAGMLG